MVGAEVLRCKVDDNPLLSDRNLRSLAGEDNGSKVRFLIPGHLSARLFQIGDEDDF